MTSIETSDAVAWLTELVEDVDGDRRQLAVTLAERDDAIRRCYALGVPNIGVIVGLSSGRIAQICRGVSRETTAPTESGPVLVDKPYMSPGPGPEDKLREAIDALPALEQGAVRGMGPIKTEPAAWSTRSFRPVLDRKTLWLDNADNGLGQVLALARRHDVSRVYLTGPRPGMGDADTCRAWFANVPHGWVATASYLANPDAPVGRYALAEAPDRTVVEVHRAASWLGEGDYSLADARDAMRVVGEGLDAEFGVSWLSTPASTGRALWQRTIPKGKGWAVQSDEVRELIHATAGQARRELLPPAAAELPGFAYLDGRLMYGALTWGMPVGEPTRWTDAAFERATDNERLVLVRSRSRWRVRFTVPKDWQHVGLFMVPDPGGGSGGWFYPSVPGQTWDTWADGCEVWLAIQQGWAVKVLEGMSWTEGKPLNDWTDRLRRLHVKLDGVLDDTQRRLARGAVRRILLFGIGGFASRTQYARNYSAPIKTAQPPAGSTDVRRIGDELHWSIPEPRDITNSHPEWAATVWARARSRLLGRGGGLAPGALWLPRAHLIAFSTDALYLTSDPGWADDGEVGRFRLKGLALQPWAFAKPAWPTSWPELYALRDATGGES